MREDGVVVVKEEKKERSFFGKLFRFAMFVVAVYGAITAVKGFMNRLAKKLEEENEGSESKRYLRFLTGEGVSLEEEEVTALELNVIAGGQELDLSEAILSEETFVTVRALLSGVVVKVPPMVRVEVDDTDVLSGFMNLVPKYEREDLPVLYLRVQSLLSGVKVEMKAE